MNSRRQSRMDAALLVIRVAVGIVMLAHGSQKLFIFGFGGVAQMFGQMGVPAPTLAGPFIALLEFCAGIAVILGLLTQLAALGLACDMAGAILLVHMKNGFFLPTGFEFAFSLFAAFIALVIAGAGGYSIDGAIARRRGEGHG